MKTPYYAVVFTNRQADDLEGYEAMAQRMMELAKQQPGFLGVEHAREDVGITVSYWETLEDIAQWKAHFEHMKAQQLGKEKWYASYSLRICRVEKEYHFKA